MNGRISKLLRRNARALAGVRHGNNPTTYTFAAGSVRNKVAPTGRLLSNGLPEVFQYQTYTRVLRKDCLRDYIKTEKYWARRLGTVVYSSGFTN